MTYPSLLTIRNRVRRELDLLDEPGITDTEINSYINEGINVAESVIHTMYGEDYFLTSASLSLVAATALYSLPSNIFAMKVRAIVYENGSIVYEIKRMNGKHYFERVQRGIAFGQSDQYRYLIMNNSAAAGAQIKLVPTAYETGAYCTVWYIRSAAILSADADVCDIPEFEDFIVAYAKNEIATNKPGLADINLTKPKTEAMYNLMVDTLQLKVPDEGDNIPIDIEFYEDMS